MNRVCHLTNGDNGLCSLFPLSSTVQLSTSAQVSLFYWPHSPQVMIVVVFVRFVCVLVCLFWFIQRDYLIYVLVSFTSLHRLTPSPWDKIFCQKKTISVCSLWFVSHCFCSVFYPFLCNSVCLLFGFCYRLFSCLFVHFRVLEPPLASLLVCSFLLTAALLIRLPVLPTIGF